MTPEQLQTIRLWFLKYTKGFAEADGILSVPLQTKLEHSGRVAEDCRRIAKGEGWRESDILTGEAIGWLHDVARFSQFKEFKTFHDPRSVNHGERGWSILNRAGILNTCDRMDCLRILEGVRYHNRKIIPNEVSTEAIPFVKLIRDADKLDIFEIFQRVLQENLFAAYPEALLHLSADGPIHPAILEDVRQRRNPSYQHIKSSADFLLVQVSWVYDMNYPSALRLFTERNILERIARHLPSDEAVQSVLQVAGEYVEAKTRLTM